MLPRIHRLKEVVNAQASFTDVSNDLRMVDDIDTSPINVDTHLRGHLKKELKIGEGFPVNFFPDL